MVLQATYDLLDYDTPRVHRFEVFTNTEFNGYLRRADGWSTALLTVFDALVHQWPTSMSHNVATAVYPNGLFSKPEAAW